VRVLAEVKKLELTFRKCIEFPPWNLYITWNNRKQMKRLYLAPMESLYFAIT